MKKIKLLFLSVLMLAMTVISGCSLTTSNKNADAKQMLMDAFRKQQEVESMAFEGEFSLNMNFDTQDPDLLAFSSFLEDLKLGYKGVMDQERVEILLEAQLNLDGFRTIVELPI
ncbi:MAG: hypothetical protein LRY71_06515 [Bacillaceae bacterium]|nr:hypothetical protein [Bacillaceae bacterium]